MEDELIVEKKVCKVDIVFSYDIELTKEELENYIEPIAFTHVCNDVIENSNRLAKLKNCVVKVNGEAIKRKEQGFGFGRH